MPIDALSGLDYPIPSSAPAGAAQLFAMAVSARGKTVVHAVDAADRDAKYGSGSGTTVPDGTLVSSPDVPALWLKTPDRWATLFQGPRSYVPQLQTSAGVAKSGTPSRCYYEIVNDVCHAHGEVLLNEDVTNCCVTLPVAAPDRFLGIGVLALYGATTPADQCGVAYMPDTSRLVVTAFTQGYRNGTAGAILRWDVRYPLITP